MKDPKRTQHCLALLRMSNGSDELPLNYTIPFMPLWKNSVMLCSLFWQPISERTLKVQYQCEGFSLLTRSNDLVIIIIIMAGMAIFKWLATS